MQSSFVADATLTEALEKQSKVMPCMREQVLFKQGEAPKGLYILKSGRAFLFMTGENGLEVMHLTIGPGSILGIPAVVTKEPYSLSAAASVDAEVEFIELSQYEELLREELSLFPLVLSALAAEIRTARVALNSVMTTFMNRPSQKARIKSLLDTVSGIPSGSKTTLQSHELVHRDQLNAEAPHVGASFCCLLSWLVA